ncbi:MAG: protein kinase [Gemmatimonadetes bacterium]|nr:protein kinase [Gemmatimonadota bacterium]
MDLREQLQRTVGDGLRLAHELGGGGMSRVFVAEDLSLGRKVVVKVLPPETAGQLSVERFRREIAIAARLQHPHIVPLLAAGESGGLAYFTMPFVSGESLRQRLASDGALPIADAVRFLREVASALASSGSGWCAERSLPRARAPRHRHGGAGRRPSLNPAACCARWPRASR